MEAQKLLTAGEAGAPPLAIPAEGPEGLMLSQKVRQIFGVPVGMLSPHDVLLKAHDATELDNLEGIAVLLRASDYLVHGEADDPGRSTRQFDPEVSPVDASAVIVGPKPGDLFTTDRVTFHEVTNPEMLVAERFSLVIHIPDGADWKTAVWEYVKDRDLEIQVWDANGIPTPIGPAD